jgi:hypothetical protein
MNKKTQEYAIAVAESIMGLFRDEEENGNMLYHYDLDKIDATDFFTGMIIGCNIVFGQLTEQDKNNLEFTYLCNQLIVQQMLEDKEKKK